MRAERKIFFPHPFGALLTLMQKVFWKPDDAPSGSKVIGQCGGQPKLALNESPSCKKCGAPMPFFFTLDVSDVLPGKFLSLFYCVSCTGSTVPVFPLTPISEPISSEEALSRQTDYRIFLHANESPASAVYSPLIETPVLGKKSTTHAYQFSKIGGTPTKYWGKDDGNIHKLLLQIREFEDVTFPKQAGTPQQQAYKLFADGPEFRDWDYYKLVGGIPVYIFATYDEQEAFLVTGRF